MHDRATYESYSLRTSSFIMHHMPFCCLPRALCQNAKAMQHATPGVRNNGTIAWAVANYHFGQFWPLVGVGGVVTVWRVLLCTSIPTCQEVFLRV